MLQKQCLRCKKSFTKQSNNSIRVWGLRKFCSSKCSATGRKATKETIAKRSESLKLAWSEGRHIGSRNYKRPKIRITLTCHHCGVEFERTPSYSGQKYCSNACHISNNLSGKSHWSWKGGRTKAQWKKENKDRVNHHTRTRRARLRGAKGSHTLGEWESLKKEFDYMCLCCKQKEPAITLTVDHIIPVSQGGTDTIDNIQPLCKSCNSQKFVSPIDYINSKTIILA